MSVISRFLVLVVFCVLQIVSWPADAFQKVRVGVLKFGTVNWELNTIKNNNFDKAQGIELEIVHFASTQASRFALQAGDIDFIVSDWLWVSRQRANGKLLAFVPYSSAIGALMVENKSPVKTLADLKGKKIGIAGGPLDKSWLLIRGLAKRDYGIDLKDQTEQIFGAPPLLYKKALQGELDAVINYWHFSARLEANGFRRLVGANDVARLLGANGRISALGYVFSETWAKNNMNAALGFLKASSSAKNLLATSDLEWGRLRELTKAKDDKTFEILKLRFREGIPKRPMVEEQLDTARIYDILAKLGGEKLVGSASQLAKGTFWVFLTDGT